MSATSGPNRKWMQERKICRAIAALLGQLVGQEPSDFDTPEQHESRAVDLIFQTGGVWFVVEHTLIESFSGQMDYVEGKRGAPLPTNTQELPEWRRQRIQRALETHLPKLEDWKQRLIANRGNCTSALVLEESDPLYGDPPAITDAFAAVLPSLTVPLSDLVFLVDTNWMLSGVGQAAQPFISAVRCLKDGQRTGRAIPNSGPLIWSDEPGEWKPSRAGGNVADLSVTTLRGPITPCRIDEPDR